MKSKISATKSQNITTYKLPQPCDAKYLVVIVNRGMTSEVNCFNSLKEAKRAFGEIAREHGYRPSEINGSDKYDVSIWELTEGRYEKVYLYI